MGANLFKKRNTVQKSVGEYVHDHMRAIKQAFPGDVKLTLVIRTPALVDPVVMTNDTAEDAISAIRKMTPGKSGLVVTS